MLGTNVGIDLGTTSILIFVEGKGIVVSEPSVVAFDSYTGKLRAIGQKAADMVGRNPDSIRVVKPMRNGVISDFTATKSIMQVLLYKVCKNMVFKPNIVVCMPSTVTNLEKRTILDLVTAAGAGKACLIEEPLAAALGAGLDISRPLGTMVVDIGGGTADIAVVTMGSISISKSIKIAGNALDEDILRYLRRERNIVIGEKTAEQIKRQIGCAYLRDVELAVEVKGKHYITGMPVTAEVTTTEVYLAMREHLEMIAEGIREVLEVTPPELAGDISETGILLTGGGALLDGMDTLIKQKTGIDVTIPENPLECVAMGTGYALEHMDILTENGGIFKTREEITGFKD